MVTVAVPVNISEIGILSKSLLSEITIRRRVKKAVILLSGGLDSATAAYCARKDIGKTGELYALTFDYGQRHSKEIWCAAAIAKALGVTNHQSIRVPIDMLVKTALTGQSNIPVNGVVTSIPSTWVPQRNSIFLAFAFALAETVGANWIYTGFNILDYSGYPDCRPEFVDSIQKSLNLASKRFIETGEGIGIVAPLMRLKKFEIIKLGSELGVPFELTTSCYQGKEKACGFCDSCRIRLCGFEEAGLKDPIGYE